MADHEKMVHLENFNSERYELHQLQAKRKQGQHSKVVLKANNNFSTARTAIGRNFKYVRNKWGSVMRIFISSNLYFIYGAS